jgi:hypothetical protein
MNDHFLARLFPEEVKTKARPEQADGLQLMTDADRDLWVARDGIWAFDDVMARP